MMRFVLLVAAFGISLPAPVQAAAACLAIGEVIDTAAREDPRLDIVAAEIAAAEAGVRDSFSLMRPQLSAFGSTSAGDNGLTSNQFDNRVGVRLSQRLYDFGDARRVRAIAGLELANSEETLRALRFEGAGEAALIALDWLQHRERLSLIDQRIGYFQELVGRLQLLLEQGGTTRDGLAAVEARLAEAEADRDEVQLALAQARARYQTILGASAPPCAGVDLEAVRAASGVNDGADLIGREADNGRLRALQGQLDQAGERRARAARSRLPAVDMVAIGSFVYDDLRGDWEYRDRVGVDLSVPLYAGNSIDAGTDRAEADLQRISAEVARLQQELREEVLLRVRRLDTLRRLVDTRRNAHAAKKRELEATELAFRLGQRTLFDLLETRLGSYDAAVAALEAQYDFFREHILLGVITHSLPLSDNSVIETSP